MTVSSKKRHHETLPKAGPNHSGARDRLQIGRADPLVKLAHARCLVRRELTFDFLRAKLCLPFLAGHWDGRDTVADKVHIAFNWLGRFSKASVKQRNRCGTRADLDLPLVAILTSASIAVAPCWRAIC